MDDIVEGTMFYRTSTVLDSSAEALAHRFERTVEAILDDHGTSIEELRNIDNALPGIKTFLTPEMSDDAILDDLITLAALHCNVEEDSIQDIYPSTPLQEGLMALTIKQPGSYTGQAVFRLPRALDLDKFRAAWELVVQRHDILRTRFVNLDSHGTLQVVLEEQLIWDSADSFESYMESLKAAPILFGKPLCQYAIVDSYFILTIHHAIYDGWSFKLLFQDVVDAYTGNQLFDRVPFQFFLQYLQDLDQEQAKSYWRTQLCGNSYHQFPNRSTAMNTPLPRSSIIREVPFVADSRASITKASIIRAAWALVLSKYTGENDVIFGETLSGRNVPLPGIEGMIGNTLTTLPMRIHLKSGSTSIEAFLKSVHETATSMIQFEQIGLQEIRRLSPDARGACEFQHMIIIQPDDNWGTSFSKLGIQPVDTGVENFYTYALTMEFTLLESELRVRAVFDDKIVGNQQMERILDQFSAVLGQLATKECGDRTIDNVVKLTDQDMEQIGSWNSSLPETIDACVHDLITKTAFTQPGAEAVCSWDGSFSYAELQSLSTRLAHHLCSLGVSTEVFVPFCFEKSKWTVVTILAIMKSGGVCVPLDPAHPQQRHENIIAQVNAKLVITSPKQARQCPWLGPQTLIVDNSVSQLPMLQRDLPRVKPENAVYVIFTSGSTGTPKGVVWEHKTLASSSSAHSVALKFVDRSRFLQFAAHVFDVSVSEIITVLICGGCICIPSDEQRTSDIASFIQEKKVDWAFLTPTLARHVKPEDVPGLKTLVLGGESIGQDNIERWKHHLQLIITYGPAESCIYCSSNEITGNERAETIGRSVGSNLWIVDANDPSILVPIGAVGEILVEGPILARGYLHDDSKTKKSFVVDLQWSLQNGTSQSRRFYRTGDLGRYDNGVIDFVGRKDGQVKVRGQRLEMNEVEHKLSQIRRIKHVVVLFPTSGSYQKQLVAVVELFHEEADARDAAALKFFPVARKNQTISILSEIRKEVWQMLPEYMIPTTWIPLINIPKNTSGKVDRAYISRWTAGIDPETSAVISELSVEKDFTKPNNAMEKELQQIWSEVLNIASDQIGIDMPFLRLGGDSISAMQVMAKCCAKNIAITTQHILRYQTIEKLALQGRPLKPNNSVIVDEDDTQFELTPIQQMHMDRGLDGDKFSQSFLLKLHHEASPQHLRDALETVVERHSMLRARFTKMSSGNWMQQIVPYATGLFSYTTSQVLDTTAEHLEPSITQTRECLDFQNGLVFAVHLFTTRKGDTVVLFTAHHLVIDLVSWRIIFSELGEYLHQGHISTPKPLSFHSWSRMQAEYIRGVSLTSTLPFDVPGADYDYWGMAGIPNRTCDTTASAFSIPQELTSRLLEGNTALNTELLDLLIAAVIYSFSRTFPDRQLPPIFNEGHGREPWDLSIDLSRTVGWFTTIYPVLVSSQSGLFDTIRKVKDVRRTIPQNGWPYFTKSVLSAQDKENFSRYFPCEILLNYSGAYQQLERDDALFSLFSLDGTGTNSSQMKRFELFDIEITLNKGALDFTFAYNTQMKHQEQISQWITECNVIITQMAIELSSMRHCLTLSDFPLTPMKYADIEKLTNEILPRIGVESNQVEDIYPCSPMQEGMLVAQTKEPDKYNVQIVFRFLPGKRNRDGIDVSRLLRSWQSVVNRHAVLRTVFVEGLSSNGLFQQIVLKAHKAELFNFERRTEEEAIRLLCQRPNPVFEDLQVPHSFTTCRVDSGGVYCRLDISHALNDALSTQIIYKELAMMYNGYYLSGSAPSYTEYISYCLKNPANDSMDYWKSYLDGARPCHLPALDAVPNTHRKVFTMPIEFSQADSSVLHDFCVDRGVTPANFFQAAWAILLRVYTGEDDVCFGYVSSGRELPMAHIQDIVGPFINMLVCRADVTKESAVLELIQQMQDEYISSIPHQRCSLARIQNALRVSQDGFFNTAISIQKIESVQSPDSSEAVLEDIGGYDPTEVGNLSDISFGFVFSENVFS